MPLKDKNNWLSKIVPRLFGIGYIKCRPVLAGSTNARKDIVERTIDWKIAPQPAVFYNLEPNSAEAAQHGDGEWSLDYVLGSSDATDHERRKISDGDLIYWRPYLSDRKPRFDDAVLVAARDLQPNSSESPNGEPHYHKDWLCLRRVGHEDGRMTDDNGRVYLRSFNSAKETIEYTTIDPKLFRGFVFGKYKTAHESRIRIAPNLPFESSNDIRPA